MHLVAPKWYMKHGLVAAIPPYRVLTGETAFIVFSKKPGTQMIELVLHFAQNCRVFHITSSLRRTDVRNDSDLSPSFTVFNLNFCITNIFINPKDALTG